MRLFSKLSVIGDLKDVLLLKSFIVMLNLLHTSILSGIPFSLGREDVYVNLLLH